MKRLLTGLVWAWGVVWGLCGGVPRVAVWDPAGATAETRFTLDGARATRLVGWLRDAGMRTDALTAEQINEPAVFSAATCDAVIVLGGVFPKVCLAALQRFSDEGGVLTSFGEQVPFLIAIERGADGLWALAPREPKFAWQSDALLKHIGLVYRFKPELQGQGVRHTPTPLLSAYLPQATLLRGRLENRWVVPLNEGSVQGEYFPLMRSLRRDGADVPGPLYVVRNGRRHAIVGTLPMFLFDTYPARWPYSRETVVALMRLAHELHDGTRVLKPEERVTIREDLTPLPEEPLDRYATGSVEPENAEVRIRWGVFNGSGAELGDRLPEGVVPVAGPAERFPFQLPSGAFIRLALPPLGEGPLYLRVRGAYLQTGAALKAVMGATTALNESFVYIDTSEAGNFSQSLSGKPVEFTRIVFLPPEACRASELRIDNPGTAPVYFDALQIERPRQLRTRCIGLGAGQQERNAFSNALSKTWGGIRSSLRTQRIGPPGDPDRFAQLDKLVAMLASKNPVIQPILEGTPPWAAITPERLADAQRAKRPTTVPPDPKKYAEIVEAVVKRYGGSFETYEIWNEADIEQFYRGVPQEYVTLFKTIVPIIRRLDPTARVMTTGMAGVHEPFLDTLSESGVFKMADLFAFHPYAGKSAAWDLPYGLAEGLLFSRGEGLEIFCNESGFPFSNAEWFRPPPDLSEAVQRDMLNVAMARLLAMGLAKLSVFNAGGDDHVYGLINGRGEPRPAYAVFADYARLNGPGAARLDIGMTREDGLPLAGIYAAATVRTNGSVTVILNPADCEALRPVEPMALPLDAPTRWTCFFGQAKYANGRAAIEPAEGKAYAGFYKSILLDVAKNPVLELSVSGETADWELMFKKPGGAVVSAVARRGAGTVRVDCASLLSSSQREAVEVSFRVYRPTVFERVCFLPQEGASVRPVALRLCVPWGSPAQPVCEMRQGAEPRPISATLHRDGRSAWAELSVPLVARTVIDLRP